MSINMEDFADNALSERLYPLLKNIAEDLNQNINVVNNAQETANTALTNAEQAQTAANNAQATANTALSTAQNSVDRLAGDADFFMGACNIVTKTSEHIVDALNGTGSQGITYDNVAKKFNFSYLGWYLIELTSDGELNNSRTDWYQEWSMYVKQNGVSVNQPTLTIPPSMIKNIRHQCHFLIKVALNDVITIAYQNTVNGTILGGALLKVKVKKVI
jgi:hypothetical protein